MVREIWYDYFVYRYFNCACQWRYFSDVKESVKGTASEAKDYVKDTGSSMAEKGRGK